jgi:hypothetical protein
VTGITPPPPAFVHYRRAEEMQDGRHSLSGMFSAVDLAVPSPVPSQTTLVFFPPRESDGIRKENEQLFLFRGVAAFLGIIREENGMLLLCSEDLRATESLRDPMAIAKFIPAFQLCQLFSVNFFSDYPRRSPDRGLRINEAPVSPFHRQEMLGTIAQVFDNKKQKGSGLVVKEDRCVSWTCQTTRHCWAFPACVCAVGVNEDGYRDVLGVMEGMKEDKESWTAFLRYLKGRGLQGVQLFISDKCLGLVAKNKRGRDS